VKLSQAKLPILDVAARAAGFSVFLDLARRAGLDALLADSRRYTIFAPTDDAFAKFPAGALAKLKRSEHADLLRAVVLTHVVVGGVRTAALAGRRIRGKSVEGNELVIDGAGAITVNGARVTRSDIIAANGVLHGLDRVIWPRRFQGAAAAMTE
jgi:uncharacterized surface protein with fasciclin (FAS1) repeats